MTIVTPYDKRSKTCPICGKSFTSAQELAHHINKEHPGVFVAYDES